ILALPQSVKADEIKFAITGNDGTYNISLKKNIDYKIRVSYLGFKQQVLELNSGETKLLKDFILIENTSQLDEVIIDYTPPITVKKDTITYQVDSFATGSERKLRELLKNLPGVEVDREGNVTSQGKKITKVLVEDKPFFNGNSKLAVNNIPADAVNEVEIIDDYNEVAMLKGLQDSEDMAMNIKLKEDKKKFLFGDIEAGAGYEDRYLVHPNLFYYSPETNLNFIGDLNNIGVKSFSFQDYLEFEGGFGKLLNDTGSYFNLFRSDFAQYLNNRNFVDNVNQFGAFNMRQSLSSSTDLSAYVISSNSKTETLVETLNDYQNTEEPFLENRRQANNINNFFTIGKITLDYDPSFKEDLALNSFIKITNNDALGLINTQNPSQNNSIGTNTDIEALNFKQNISYSRKLSQAHTATLEATYSFLDDQPITEWLSDQRILSGLIPLEDDDIFNIQQNKRSKSHNVNAILKDYWVINNFNHLYTSVGVNMSFNDFFSREAQLLSDGTVNDFSSAGFGNEFGYNFIDSFLGLEYKFMIGKTTFKPALFYHGYLWRTKQFDEVQTQSKNLLLPNLNIKTEFSNSEKLNFNYRLNARFPAVNQLANRFIMSSFNSVFRGNELLENQLYHSASLSYYKFSLFRQLNFNIGTSFNRRLETIKTVSQLEGIESFNTQIMFDMPENNWNLNGRISKKINKITYNLRGRFSYNDFFQLLNDSVDLNISKSYSGTAGIETAFKEFPNIEVNYTKDFSNYRSLGTDNKFENDRFEIFLEYDFLKDFIFKTDYTFDNYNNISQNLRNTFDVFNASLFYQKEDSPWGFELNATNIFDVRFRRQNSFNSFIISDQRTFVMPRIIMFKLSYKL
ncbi:MAG: carboxypeptidase regulatory-like domain-containing protein, partial [Bacteroidota bacterium]